MTQRSAARSSIGLATTFLAGFACIAPAVAAEWRAFANPRFGFSVEVPATFRAAPPPENGDGRRFTSPDGTTEIRAYGHLLSEHGDLRADAEQMASFERQDGLVITYRSVGAHRFALSGRAGSHIVYIVSVPTCGGDASATVRIAYPAALKASLDPIVAHLAASLRGSARC